ncbi:phosphotransferase [Chengkuizengella axinellae]|uniref:Phosphotransferase n=1 Tax=Chengkuizengella axinellae TaxID=3064388 RepID=A0ABT9J3Y4_9BACL|nr:phosphotransferase [Chengkuizengella sp. 2205SS18-9]MDP5276309.1 phosphotransferase [Chengkuizengella sp. 2205SS18-9]
MSNIQFKKLCGKSQLGEIISSPAAVSGGLLHKMYVIETSQGKYAIKILNPQIMMRAEAMQNYIHSEKIANLLSNTIPALPAKKCNHTFIQEFENVFYLIFDWIDGHCLKPNEIETDHCEKIGTILADIHKADFSELNILDERSNYEMQTDWDHYLHKGKESNSEWVKLLLENMKKLKSWTKITNESVKLLASNHVISHRDLDPKNVMWNFDNPILIDWESAGHINPLQDLIETAIYWSKMKVGDIDKKRFFAFINGYKKRTGILEANWKMVLANGFWGKLGWLEYNLKRSLWIECSDEEEQQLGTSQVISTINAINQYSDMTPKLENWLNNEL